jgi:hypothetical protein
MKARGRSGDDQGSLMMGADFEAELAGIVGKGLVNAEEGEVMAKALDGLNAPKHEEWQVPAAPDLAEALVINAANPDQRQGRGSQVLYLPPFSKACRSEALGTGLRRTEALEHGDQGSFDLMSSAGPGQYSYVMSSACNSYKAEDRGWLKIDFSLLLWGQGIVAVDKGGKAELEIGIFAALCAPAGEGKYWQEPGISIKEVGRERYENRLVHLTAHLPVQKGIEYSIGTGVTARSWAWGNSAAGVRLWGKQTHAIFSFSNKGPAETPY